MNRDALIAIAVLVGGLALIFGLAQWFIVIRPLRHLTKGCWTGPASASPRSAI